MHLLKGIYYDHVVFYTTTQLSIKSGMRRWGEPATEEVSTEFEQLHYRETFEPVNHRSLSNKEHKKVLESHLFLKQKRKELIKGRMVAEGNKQRGTIEKEDAVSPPTALESVILKSTIDDADERDVAVIDIPNVFIQTRIKDDKDKVVLRLRGKLADLLIKTAPEIYRKHITINRKGETVMYSLNEIYGIMKAALLLYQKFVGDLIMIGFKLNTYDPCVANKTINWKQLTLVRHVDDIEASHVEAKVVTHMAKWLRKTYKRLFKDRSGKMSLCRSKIYDYLGMNLYYTTKGEVKITMIPYIKEMIQDFREHDTNPYKKANIPAT